MNDKTRADIQEMEIQIEQLQEMKVAAQWKFDNKKIQMNEMMYIITDLNTKIILLKADLFEMKLALLLALLE